MEYAAIQVNKKNGVATITINRPDVANALVQEVLDELAAATEALAADGEVKVVVLTGTGKAFCAGGDIGRFKDGFDAIGGLDYVDGIHRFIKAFAGIGKPTIAAVNGAAAGAGMSLMLLCDMAFLADSATVTCAFVNMGLAPDCALAYYLPRTVGVQRANELMLTGRRVPAAEAVQMGMACGVYPAGELLEQVTALAERLAAGPSHALRLTKRMIGAGLDMDLNAFLGLEALIQSACFLTDDSREAVEAFLQKRSPRFQGK